MAIDMCILKLTSALMLITLAMAVNAEAKAIESVAGAKKISQMAGKDSSSTAALYVQDGLIAMYDGIENAGWGKHSPHPAKWVNLAGTGWDGVIGADVIVEDNAMRFDGVRDDRSTVQVQKGWWGQPPHITVESVVQPLGWNYRGQNGTMAAFGATEGNTGGFTFWAYAQTYGRSCYQFRDSTGRKEPNLPTASSFIGSVLQTSATADGSMLVVYANAEACSSMACGDLVYSGAENYTFYIGADWFGKSEYNFNGRIFCLRVYNRALSQEELAHNYEIDKERFNLR